MNDIDVFELIIDSNSTGYYIIEVNSPFNNDEQRYYLYSHENNAIYKIVSIGSLIDELNNMKRPFKLENVNNLEKDVLISYFNMLYESEIGDNKEYSNKDAQNRMLDYYSKINNIIKKNNNFHYVDVMQNPLIDNKVSNLASLDESDKKWIDIYKLNFR